MINQKEYYQEIKDLNIKHYAGETLYYTQAPVRNVEHSILLKLNKGANILDLGCGSGRFSIGAAQAGFNVIGVDITPDAINAAQQKAEKLGIKNVQFLVGDMTALSFKDETFDYVFCPRFSINAVATFSQRKKAIEEMARVVKDDGSIFIESFNKLYLGKGIIFLLRNILRDLVRYLCLFYCFLFEKQYKRLLPGDIVYKANKSEDAPKGYAHLPTIFELRKLMPQNVKIKFYSIPQIIQGKKFDILKFFRYSIWIFIIKKNID